MNNKELQEQLTKTINGLGYNLIDVKNQSSYGVLQLFIERSKDYVEGKNFPVSSQDEQETESESSSSIKNKIAKNYPQVLVNRVSVEDCAFISNHLARVFAVESVDYQRLEVSSPGLDRKIGIVEDFAFFSGMPIKLTCKEAVNKENDTFQRHFRGNYVFVNNADNVENSQVKIEDNGNEYIFELPEIESVRLDEDEILGFWTKKDNKNSNKPKVKYMMKNTNRKKEAVYES